VRERERERERERDLPWLLLDRVVCNREEEEVEEEEHHHHHQCDVLAGSLRKNKNKKMITIINWTC
jgi:hypothetical protein